MSETKHTPGPWANTDTESEPIITADEGHTDLAMLFDLSTGEQRANARLIAAAPELLEALRGLVGWAVGSRALDSTLAGKTHAEHGGTCALCAARAAITKAIGGVA